MEGYGQGADGLPCIGELRSAFQGQPRCHPGRPAICKTCQYFGGFRCMGVASPTPAGGHKGSRGGIPCRTDTFFFAIVYVDDAYFALRDPVFLQTALDILVELFERVGLETNRLKMQAMICIPGRIRTQLLTASYHCMRLGFQTSKQWEACHVNCSHCNTTLQARSLPLHLATLHGVYRQSVVAGELLDKCTSGMYMAEQCPDGKLQCPVNGCLGILKDAWNMR